jgi:hypothetical protein
MSRTPLANESTEMHRLLRGAVAGCLADVVRWVPRGEAQPPSAPLAAAPQRRERPSTATPSREPVPPPLVAPLAVALGTDRLRAAFDLWLRYDGSDRLTQCWWMSCPDGISGPTAHVTSPWRHISQGEERLGTVVTGVTTVTTVTTVTVAMTVTRARRVRGVSGSPFFYHYLAAESGESDDLLFFTTYCYQYRLLQCMTAPFRACAFIFERSEFCSPFREADLPV